ncbi:hypothetical protein EOK75_04335 [Pseudorhodobacter turbinis]|uniref:Phytol kinase n=1 Tax=Pseudorhodobacter turbinis TaxID=2500533 RepID=A0A4P8EE17_9RHOB|nr:hypothetical protein [Pseudorhodobacter turbinis]QCO55076.1 hypothetical protein EOK75_04335 [Pseudorhodobacter turbinis]
MSAFWQLMLALASVAVLLGLMGVVRQLAAKWQIGAEVQRKLIHIGTGLYALVLPWLFPERWPVYLLVGVTLGVMLVLRLPNSRLGKTLHGVGRSSYGDLLLAISVGLCLFLAQDRLYLYVLPIAVLTLADAAAALAGSTYGTRFFKIEDGIKSIEGSVVFFFVTLLISILCLMVMTGLAPLNIIVLSVMVAGFGTLVEATSWRGFDNFFLPLGLLVFLSVHATSPLAELLTLAGIFAISIIIFRTVAPRIGLSKHAAHVYVITVFLLLAVTMVQNALLPILVLAAHAWARSAAPCGAKLPDLDVVAALALVSFGWLTLGTASGWNAVSFYGMTAMGMTLGLSALALTPKRPALRIAGLLAEAGAICLLYAGVISLNPDASNWNGAMWPVVLGCLFLAAAVPSFCPQWFLRARVGKLTLLALVIPLSTYLISIGISA